MSSRKVKVRANGLVNVRPINVHEAERNRERHVAERRGWGFDDGRKRAVVPAVPVFERAPRCTLQTVPPLVFGLIRRRRRSIIEDVADDELFVLVAKKFHKDRTFAGVRADLEQISFT